MKFIINILESLMRLVQAPELFAVIVTSFLPLVAKLVGVFLRKNERDEPRKITVKSSSGKKSITIELENMSEEDAKKAVRQLQDLVP